MSDVTVMALLKLLSEYALRKLAETLIMDLSKERLHLLAEYIMWILTLQRKKRPLRDKATRCTLLVWTAFP